MQMAAPPYGYGSDFQGVSSERKLSDRWDRDVAFLTVVSLLIKVIERVVGTLGNLESSAQLGLNFK